MKKLISRLLLLCLLFSCVFPVSAYADYTCPNCGASFSSLMSRNFHKGLCTVSALKITSVTSNDDGTVTVRWSGGTAPYSVHYEFEDPAPNDFWWTEEESTYSTRCILPYLAPNVDYILTVKDANGKKATYNYCQYTYTYNEIGTQADIKLRIREYGETRNVSRFSASDIESSWNTAYGLYIKLSYSMLARAREYRYRFVIAAPNGYSQVWDGTLNLPAGRSSLGAWQFFDLTDYFNSVERWYNEVPIGYYEFRLYYDDVHVLTERFYVGG